MSVTVPRYQPTDGWADLTAFRRVYDDHAGAVHATASRYCGHVAADDITQEVFVGLWRRPGQFDPSRGSMRTFLLTVARNLCIDALRSEDSRRRREENDKRRWPAPMTGIDDTLVAADLRHAVRTALEQLPTAERDALVTAYYGGRTYRQAAEVLGVCEGTVKSRIRRGLRRLHHSLTNPLGQ